MSTLVAVGLVVLLSSLWIYFKKQRTNLQIENAFKGRQPLSDVEFFNTYYCDSGVPRETVIGVREVLMHKLQLDVSRIIPTDDFSRNLGFLLKNDDMADVEIVKGLQRRFSVEISNQEAMATTTIHEIIMLIHAKERSKTTPNPSFQRTASGGR